MDLKLNNRNISELNKEKRTKFGKNWKNKVLSQNNNIEAFNSAEESDEDIENFHSLNSKHKQTKELIINSSENTLSDSQFVSNKSVFLEGLLNFFSNSSTLDLKLITDWIHERYVQYLTQTETQKDSTKTDFTYAHSFSYNKFVDSSNIWNWSVPNMSRKTIGSVRATTLSTISKSEFSIESKSSSTNSSKTFDTSSGKVSTHLSESRRTPDPTSSMFTRSQCLGGAQCAAPGCLIHKRVKKKSLRSEGVVIPNSGQGLEPECEFSEDDDYTLNNRLNHQKVRDTSYRTNGFGYTTEDESEEEIAIIKRVNKIFRTTINNTISNTSRILDSITPNTVKKMANSCPTFWLLLLSLMSVLGIFVYSMGSFQSSLWSGNSLGALTGDLSTRYAINELFDEIKQLKSDLTFLKKSKEEDIKTKMNGNENLHNLNDRIDSIEDYLNNIMTNCCRNETDSMLALIDLRLSEFMASMLDQNQNNVHTITPSEASQQLKAFIQLELSKTNDNFRESIETKLMSTIEIVENRMNHKSDHLSSKISIDEIKSIISEALAIYDADKTGQPDFALEPAGGAIVNTRCSETFDPHGIQYKLAGIPFWSTSVSPRAVIQPTITQGECWAFKGSKGYLVIKLSQKIIPTAFSYEHIPKQISRDGNIDSAPKEFQVRGLDEETDTTGHLLGNYVYEENGRPMQYFEVQDPNPRVFQLIELVILSNHGHSDYTCLYRFRVHGKRVGH